MQTTPFHTETRGGIIFKLYAEPDCICVRGNAMASGDDALDTKVENAILKRLEKNDIWAWASVSVTAEFEGCEGSLYGSDRLGACSYASWKQFIRGKGYWPDMKEAAKADLFSKLQHLVDAAEEAAEQ